jgi:hypothetical protein
VTRPASILDICHPSSTVCIGKKRHIGRNSQPSTLIKPNIFPHTTSRRSSTPSCTPSFKKHYLHTIHNIKTPHNLPPCPSITSTTPTTLVTQVRRRLQPQRLGIYNPSAAAYRPYRVPYPEQFAPIYRQTPNNYRSGGATRRNEQEGRPVMSAMFNYQSPTDWMKYE